MHPLERSMAPPQVAPLPLVAPPMPPLKNPIPPPIPGFMVPDRPSAIATAAAQHASATMLLRSHIQRVSVAGTGRLDLIAGDEWIVASKRRAVGRIQNNRSRFGRGAAAHEYPAAI